MQMKKLVLLGVLTGLLFSSCSEYEPNTETDVVENFVSMDDVAERVKLDMIFKKLDSLNQTIPTRVSRGGDKGIYITYADCFGGLCGAKIGERYGGRVGASFGPVGAFLGAVAGQLICRELGYKGASALVRKAFGCAGYAVGVPSNILTQSDCSIKIAYMMTKAEAEYNEMNTPNLCLDIYDPDIPVVPSLPSANLDRYEMYDSIGYYHNKVMVLINNDTNGIYVQNGRPNINRIYDDMVLYSNQPKIDSIAHWPDLESDILNIMSDLNNIALDGVAKNASTAELVSAYINYMADEYGLTENEILIINNFYVKIVEKCASIPITGISDYAVSLNTLLEEMDIADSLRLEMALGAQAIINSSLCWNQ